ncbi:nuclear transport factor 2 family protein [Xanthocytophaga flava]|uniref:nuclear transport factor 2 family protein n=1 Tax=Xanthocytophaga flava TaxID=3048013 RepID=UPI0028D2EF75|nr:nuclear transport factor 2 family protein [Xanthocytophaga flavus]MDJ1469115.1 nuclear transport factor 2 family protein [Xanthocytophaga flavus]
MQSDSSQLPITSEEKQLILAAYQAFNARNVDTALTLMTPDVHWPNGMEGGYVYGPAEVKSYWLRQWTMINPTVQPSSIHKDNTGRIVVEVHQVVKDLSGNLLQDKMLYHLYTLTEGLIKHMEIREL